MEMILNPGLVTRADVQQLSFCPRNCRVRIEIRLAGPQTTVQSNTELKPVGPLGASSWQRIILWRNFPNLVVAFVSFNLSDSQPTQFQPFSLCPPQTIPPPTTPQLCGPSKHKEHVQCWTKAMRVQKKMEALQIKIFKNI